MTGREIRDNRPTIDLNLMWNQLTCLNASITLSKLPIMMQTQIQATNMRWGGRTLKSLQPWMGQCQIQLFATVDSHTIIAKQKYDDQIPINKQLELDVKSTDLPQCINNFFQTSNYDANTNPSNQYEMRRDNLKKFATMSRANAEYNYLPQLTLTL
jgi:hypothetical protein